MNFLRTIAISCMAVSLIGLALEKRVQSSDPPPEVTPPQEVSSATPAAGPAAVEEPVVWYSNYDAAGKVAIKTGRPLIVAVTEKRPDCEPTEELVYCWLPLTPMNLKKFANFAPPCVLRCEAVPRLGKPIFEPYKLEK